jgi:hypothetical protein
MTIGKRTRGTKAHVITYDGKASLLALLDAAEDQFLNLFDEAARLGWIDGDRFLELDQAISYLVIKHDVPQS